MSHEKRTLVEEGTEFRGEMSSKHPVVVMGKVEGDLSGPVVHVSDTGVVAGRMVVNELHSTGEIAGEIDADEVHLSGRVRDKTIVRAKRIEVNLAPADGGRGVLFGDCDLEIGDVPDKQAIIAAAAGARVAGPAQVAAVAEPAAVSQEVAPEASGAGGRKGRKGRDERSAER
jgi:cytoskeletal protein CcmA (bactofilin family)